jgi:hypothetical protein
MSVAVVGVDGSGKDGGFVWWSPNRMEVAALTKALDDVGLSNLAPKASTVPAALKETLNACISGARIRVRGKPISFNPLSDEVKGCEAVMREPGKEANVHDFVMSIVLDGNQVKVAKVNHQHLPHVAGKEAALERLLTNTFHDEMNWYPTTMVSSCVARVIQAMGGVLCKENGGVYFLPESVIDRFEAFADSMESSGRVRITLTKFPLRPGERSYRLVAESIRKEIQDALLEIEEGLAQIGKGDARANGQRSRLARLMELRDKVASYEQILGITMSDLHDAVEKVREAVAAHTVLDDLSL